jgi:short-subunit dehydrogenase
MTTRTRIALAAGLAGLSLGRWLAKSLAGPYSFRGKVALVTGGSRGLGLLIARELAKEGGRVAICARDPAELEAAHEELSREGAEILAVCCDLTDPDQIRHVAAETRRMLGSIDILINNAGMIQVGPAVEMELSDFENAMALHFFAPLRLTLAVLPEMRARRSGRIVNISSIGGLVAMPHLLPYVASKFALTGLSEGTRAELAEDGVLVTTVCPGLMRTGSAIHAHLRGQADAEQGWFGFAANTRLATMSAERAARKIVAACRRGRPFLVLSLKARALLALHGLAPNMLDRLLGRASRFLPSPSDRHALSWSRHTA